MYRSRHVSRLSHHTDVELDEQDVCYPNYRNFLSRLRSFPPHFPPPHFAVSRATLAHEGFFFHPANTPPPHSTDRTACYACGLELSRWKAGDQAEKEHRRMAGSGCPLIEARDRRRRGSGAIGSAAAGGGSGEGRGSSRLRGAKSAAVSGSTAVVADDGSADTDSQSRRESDARMVAAVWSGGRTQLSELRASQRKKRKHEVIDQLTGGKRARATTAATTAAAVAGTRHIGANKADVLRALFMQEVLMAIVTPR